MNLSNNNSLHDEIEIKKIGEIVLYFNIILTAVGTAGNIISIHVFLHKTLRKRKFNLYLSALTVFELIFCLTLFIDNIFVKIHKRKIFLHELNKISLIVIDFLTQTTVTCSSLLNLLLSLDRVYAVKHPMKIKEFITNLHAKKLIITSLVLLITLKSISFSLCEIYSDRKGFIVYCSLVSPFLFGGIPLIIIAILNSLLAISICNYNLSTNRSESVPGKYTRRQSSVNSVMGSLSNKNDQKGFRNSIPLRRNTLDVHNDFSVENKSNSNNKLNSIDINDARSSSSTRRNTITSDYVLRKFSNAENRKKQKSHYIVILFFSLWSIISSIPYYILMSFLCLFQLNFISMNFNIHAVVKFKIIFSIFFNLNHCSNFFIYLIFHTEFRMILCLRKQTRFKHINQIVNNRNRSSQVNVNLKFNETFV